MGLDVYKAEVEKLLGYQLEPARPFTFDRNIDDFGWHTGEDGRHHFTMFIENGRVQDEPGRDFKTGLREIAKVHKGTFRLTANQHLLISDIPNEELKTVKNILAKYKMDNLNFSGLRLSSSACVAFPTCGLAMAESERVSCCSMIPSDLFLSFLLLYSISLFSLTRSRRSLRKRACATTPSS
mgnify:CR=1 FL=1